MSSYLIGDDGSLIVGKQTDDQVEQTIKPKKLSPFDFVNAITYGKQDMFPVDETTGKRNARTDSEYPKFLINRALSYFSDTILFANVANSTLNNVPNASHFDFYRLAVDRKRRFAKWAKPIDNEDVDLICNHYQINKQKAIEVLTILSPDDLNKLRKLYNHGGKRNQQ